MEIGIYIYFIQGVIAGKFNMTSFVKLIALTQTLDLIFKVLRRVCVLQLGLTTMDILESGNRRSHMV